jgi:hypothetical protein
MPPNQLTIEQLGAQIKAKYPDYASVPDGVLGLKMAQKYPQYQALIKATTPTQKIALAALARQGVKPTEPAVETFRERAGGVLQRGGQRIGEAITGTGRYEDAFVARRVAGATAGVGQIPLGIAYQALPKGVRKGAEKVGGVLGKGIGRAASVLERNPKFQEFAASLDEKQYKKLEETLKTLSETGEVAGQALLYKGIYNVGKSTYQVGKSAVKKVTEKAGTGLKKGGEVLHKQPLDPTADQARMLQNYRGNVEFTKQELAKTKPGSSAYKELQGELRALEANPPRLSSETALERGLMGTEKRIGQEAVVEKMKLWKHEVEPALKASKATISKEKAFSKLSERVTKEIDPTRRADLLNSLDDLAQDYAGIEKWGLFEGNQLKSSLRKFVSPKFLKGKDISSVKQTLRGELADILKESILEELPVGMRTKYLDYGNLKELSEIGVKALTGGGLKGGFGSFWTTLSKRTVTPVYTVGGQVLYRVGNVLEFIGRPGLRTFGDHLLDLGLTLKVNTIPIAVGASAQKKQ